MDINNITFGGRVTRDPEITTAGTTTITKFGMCANNFISKDRSDPCFVDVVAFGPRGEAIERNVRKGDTFIVTGRLSYSKWDDKTTGKSRSKLEIIVSDFSFCGNASGDAGAAKQATKRTNEVPF